MTYFFSTNEFGCGLFFFFFFFFFFSLCKLAVVDFGTNES
jgi:hypothetical protein